MSVDVKQKLQDFKLLMKSDRRTWAIVGAVVLSILFLMFGGGGNQRRRPMPQVHVQTEKANSPTIGEKDAYRDLTIAFRNDIENLAQAAEDQQATVNRLQGEIRQYKNQSTGIFESLVDRVEEMTRQIERIDQNLQTRTEVAALPPQGEQFSDIEPDELSPFGFEDTTVPPPPPPPETLRLSVVSPGDVVPLKLLTGVNAPVDGTPYPVVFKLNGPITGPDGSALDLGEARLIAAAQGSEADSRVLFRLTNLAIRHKDGRRSVVKVDGWVVGEDGIRGMRGRLIDKLGRLIAATAGVSFAAALGERIDDKNDARIVNSGTIEGIDIDSTDVDAASASALTDASNRIGQILLDRYEKLVPVVEILSGREVVAVFSRTAEVELIDDSFNEDGIFSSSLN